MMFPEAHCTSQGLAWSSKVSSSRFMYLLPHLLGIIDEWTSRHARLCTPCEQTVGCGQCEVSGSNPTHTPTPPSKQGVGLAGLRPRAGLPDPPHPPLPLPLPWLPAFLHAPSPSLAHLSLALQLPSCQTHESSSIRRRSTFSALSPAC